ncbi:MAG: hypothetical protein VKJ04_04580 [Vampirovibrionales bacterium]|nr:hypothetical protein [Vampirovibrionales bacterium]
MAANTGSQLSKGKYASNKQQVILAGVGILLLAVIAFFIWRQSAAEKGMPLYVYYPQQTTLFFEASPGEPLTRRVLHWIEAQEFKAGNLSQSSGVKKPSTRVGQPLKTPASQEEIEQFRRALFDKFDTTFEPRISIGLWPENLVRPEDAAEKNGKKIISNIQKAKLANGSALVILPLKKELSFPELVSLFNGNQKNYKAETLNNVTYYVEISPGHLKTDLVTDLALSQNAFAIINQSLFISNRPQILQNVILTLNAKQTGRKGGNIYDHPTIKKYLGLLDKNRDGTLIVNSTAYSEQLKAMSENIPASLPAPLLKRALLYADVTPLMLGALHVENETRFSTDFFMPLNLKALGNPKLASEIKALYAEKKPLLAAAFLPANTTFLLDAQSLDHWYDLYANHLMPPPQQTQLKQAGMLLSLVQLDWRDDLIGLLSGESAFASIDANPFPIVLLESNEKKQASYNKILNIMTSGKFFPAQHKDEQIGKVAVKTFVIPKQQQTISVGVVSEKKRQMIAFAQADSFGQLAPLQKENGIASGQAVESLGKLDDFKALSEHLPKNTALFLYSDVEANQKKLEQILAEARRNRVASNQATLALMEIDRDKRYQKTDWLSKLAVALWAEPKGETEDLIQARIAFQLKPEK